MGTVVTIGVRGVGTVKSRYCHSNVLKITNKKARTIPDFLLDADTELPIAKGAVTNSSDATRMRHLATQKQLG